ncbi:MAG: DNA polymerase III subunit delta [Verrucomicrobiota bacterium]|jgi:DNA polymerase-3 subunit delta
MATRKASAAAKNPNLHFVTGSDEAEVRIKAKGLAAELAPIDAGEFGLEIIEAPADSVDCSVDMVESTLQAVLTLPFFGGGKLVWMKGVTFLKDSVQGRSEFVQAALEKLLKVLEEGLPEGITLLVSAPEPDKRKSFYKSLCSLANTTLCDKPDFGFNGTEDDLIDWVIRRCRERCVKIDEQAAVVLTTRVGANTGQLDAELAKLVTSSGEGIVISEQLVRDLVPFTRSGGIFDLSNAINKRNLPLCLDTLAQLRRQGENAIGILLAAIVPTVRNLLIAKDLMERHRLKPPAQANYFTSELNRLSSKQTAHLPRKKDGSINYYSIGLAAMNSRLFEREHLVCAFLACRDTNQKLLSGYGSEETLLTQLLVRIVANSP